jgi:HAD superfamily hydrolase (TIGR01549 family)
MTHTALVFDFFGVISSEVAPFWLRRHLPEPEAEQIKRSILDDADRGLVSQDALFAALAKRVGLTAAEVEQEWLCSVRIDFRLITLIDSLRGKRRLALLTNAMSRFVRGILATHDLERRFERIIVSSEHGCAKPDAAIYQLALHQLGVPAAAALMIDDNPANIAGATAVGMHGLLFRSTDELKAQLANRS